MNVAVSMVANARETETRDAEPGAILAGIRGGRWREPVEKIREAYRAAVAGGRDPKAAVADLKKGLPGVLWSGRFTLRAKAGLETHSGILVADVDGLSEAEAVEASRRLSEDPHAVAGFISPTGTGCKVLFSVPADPEQHGASFAAVRARLRDVHGLAVDESGKDVSRLCFVSWDPDAWANPFPEVLRPAAPEPRPAPAAPFPSRNSGPPDEAEARDALRFISPNCDRGTWLRVGMALRDGFNEGGESLWREWSLGAPDRFNERDFERDWSSLRPGGGVTIATLYGLARDAGWRSQSRNTIHSTEKHESGGRAMPGALILPNDHCQISESARVMFSEIAPTRTLFARGGAVVELIAADGGLVLSPVSDVQFRSRIERYGKPVMAWRVGDDGKLGLFQKACSTETAMALLATREAQELLPQIALVTRAPVLVESQDGRLVIASRGYHPNGGGVLVTDGASPELMPISEAVQSLVTALADFDFVSPGDRARAFASFVTPAMRMARVIPGSCPVDVWEADASQAGKGYGQKLVRAVYGEQAYMIAQKSGGVGGLDESLCQALVSGRPFVQFDNLRGRVASQFLEAVLTSAGPVQCRVPRQPEIAVDVSRVCFQSTSNGAESTEDLANRSCIVRIRKRPAGYKFARYAEGNIVDHVAANQSRFLGAVFSIVLEWDRLARPTLPDPGHDFREWAGALGFIVETLCGCAPLMSGHRAAQERVANSALSWLRAVGLAALKDAAAGRRWSASELWELGEEAGLELPGDRGGGDPDRGALAAGRVLKRAFGGRDKLTVDDVEAVLTESTEWDSANRKDRVRRSYEFRLCAQCASCA